MGKQAFTAARVSAFACPENKRQSLIWCGKTPGLGLRATPAGAKSYIFETRLHGNTIRVTIGGVKAWTLGDAQAEARRLRTEIDRGIDPREAAAERRKQAELKRADAKRAEITVGEAWDTYVKDRAHKWGTRHHHNMITLVAPGGIPRGRGRRQNEPNMTVAGPLYPLMKVKLSNLTAEIVADWLRVEVARRPTWAAQGFRALRAFLGWAADQPAYAGLIHADACSKKAVRELVPRPKAKSDALQREQLKGWFAAVRMLSNPTISAYLQILLLIGARRDELASLRWEDVDLKWGAMTLHDKAESKNGADGVRTVPVTPYVATLLAAIKVRNETPAKIEQIEGNKKVLIDDPDWKPSPWVFPSSAAKSGRLMEPRIAHMRACKAAEINGLSIHGLRRSFKSLSEWVEAPVGVVAQVMGHKPSATAEKHYTVRPLDLLRLWHSRIEAWILAQAGIEQPIKAEPDQAAGKKPMATVHDLLAA